MWELVVVWIPENEKQIFEYETQAEAESARDGYIKAFGNQLWVCIRKKVR